MDLTSRILALQSIIAAHYPDWHACDFVLIGEGTESLVYRAETCTFGPVAIKIPRTRWLPSSSGPVDYRKYMRQEAALAEHARQYGVPTPHTHAVHFDDELDFVVSEFIASDGSAPDEDAFGRLVRDILNCPLPGLSLGSEDGETIHAILANRLTQRARALEQIAGISLPRIQRDALYVMLDRHTPRASLLHMDARPANLFTRQGRILAISDWTNALIGDPALELARAAECGILTPAFLAGYGVSEPFAQVPCAVETIYRLDTAVMLARLFLAELQDEQLGRAFTERALILHESL